MFLAVVLTARFRVPVIVGGPQQNLSKRPARSADVLHDGPGKLLWERAEGRGYVPGDDGADDPARAPNDRRPERSAPITGSMISTTDGVDDLPAIRGWAARLTAGAHRASSAGTIRGASPRSWPGRSR